MINEHDTQDETRSAFGWLKAGERPDDRLTRCADLVPMAMRREQCDLAGAVRHVLQLLAELPAPDVFILRDGYAKPWQPGPVRRSGRRWTDGQPVPAGYCVGFVNHNGTRPFVAGSHGGRIQLSASGQVLTWQGPGPEPTETHADLWERLGAEWLSLAPTGRIDRQVKSGRIGWASSLAIRHHVAVAAGLQDGDSAAGLPAGITTADPSSVIAEVCIVHPEGGAWPHKPGAEWTDQERDALFEMRHRLKMTDKATAQAIGINSHQLITQQIGSHDAWKLKGGSGYRHTLRWRPSAALLLHCALNTGRAKLASA